MLTFCSFEFFFSFEFFSFELFGDTGGGGSDGCGDGGRELSTQRFILPFNYVRKFANFARMLPNFEAKFRSFSALSVANAG